VASDKKPKAAPDSAKDKIIDAVVIEESDPDHAEGKKPDGDLAKGDKASEVKDSGKGGDKVKAAPKKPATKPEKAAPKEAEVVSPVAAPVVVRRGGFFPMVLGGAVAAGIGFVGANMIGNDGWPFGNDTRAVFEAETTASIAAQNAALDALQSDLSGVALKADISGMTADIEATQKLIADVAGQLAQVSTDLNDLQVRLTDLEKRPITEGLSDAAVAAFEGELALVQDALAAQRAEIEATSAAAADMEARAEISETEAMKRAALSQIQTALDLGTGFGPSIENLRAAGEPIPQVLEQVAEKGVLSLAGLQGAYPVAARAALNANRGAGGDEGGFGAFLRNQLGARSLEPKEGASTDAVLSRAEAALAQGRLLDAMAELQTLPDDGRAAMSDWLASAQLRQNALAAAGELGQQINSN